MKKKITDALGSVYEKADHVTVKVDGETTELVGKSLQDHIKDLEKRMHKHAENLEFEDAARLRDEIKRLETAELGI